MLKRSLLIRLLPGLAVLGVMATSFLAGPLGLFGSLAGYGYGACGYGYAYTGSPVVTGVSPSFGGIAGGTAVTVTGHGFCNNLLAVHFGATQETGLPNVISDTQVDVTSPAHIAATVDVTVTNGAGTSPVNAPADHFTFIAAAPGNYTPVNPTRVLDTRISGPKLGQHLSRDLLMAGVSVPANATAVVVNVTATDTTSFGFFTVYPTTGTLPLASNLNWVKGQTVPNLVMVNLGGGSITIYNGNGAANAVVDLEGYYSPTSLDGFVPLPPSRDADTRTGSGRPNAGQHLGAGGTVNVQITGVGGVPPTGAAAVVLNVTATNTSAASFITAWPAGGTRPLASNLNWIKGKTIPNRVVVPIGTAGQVSFYNGVGTMDLVVDVNGYFLNGSAPGAQFVGVTPNRLVDTRNGTGGVTGRVPAGATLIVQIAGNGGVPLMASATPPSAAILNVTADAPTRAGFFVVYPGGLTSAPFASDLNFVASQTVPNLVVVQLGPTGDIKILNGGPGATHMVVDVVGWMS